MVRTASVYLIVFVAACGGESPAPVVASTSSSPAAAPKAASHPPSEAPASTAIVDQDGKPIVRNGMRASSLGAGAPMFAAYLNKMHSRIHPEFADKELPKLASRPADDPANDTKLATRLEIVVNAQDGRIVKLDVAKTSGVQAFDAAVLESVQRAQPFGAAPLAATSADGNVYVDWEFRREEVYACSSMHSRPFLFTR